ncbi:hypothetical protein GCM10010873_32430 [Cypionkella aquatica]|uniref:Fido domain-containing protein n=1 Tax=Cypionkella aquatica TaxID=1756042 RepID=A0AA37U634_9RHOB|nr:Fic family protein [Cypionkella aquatica]GLS88269.1 hypothetical protein GCM10010873_32430 [Cypionkella aquatica]
MILYDLNNSEASEPYQALAISNGDRQFSFLQSIVNAALSTNQLFLSQSILKALNFHAIACLHTNAGEYRPCPVYVHNGDGNPENIFHTPEHFRVSALMDNFINLINSTWSQVDPVTIGAFILWKLCAIHPFINGNGRTARAACYFAICVKAGGWLPGDVILPTLLKRSAEYIPALKAADASHKAGALDLTQLQTLIGKLLNEQIASAQPPEA